MYSVVKSRVQVDEFECLLGVRQEECLSPFLFAMYLNDIEKFSKLTNLKVSIWVLSEC